MRAPEVRGTTVGRWAGALGLCACLALSACSADSSSTPGGAASTGSAPGNGSSAAVPAPATTPVPAPTPGDTRSSLPSKPTQKRKPVALQATGEAAEAVRVRMTRIDAIDAKASGPGEVAGPALALTVEIENGTNQQLDLGTAVVNLTASDGAPGSLMSASPAKPFPPSVAAAKKATGVYVFTVPKGKRNPVTVEVSVRAQDPLVVFRGRAAG